MTIIDPIFEVDLDTSDFIDVAISLELSGGGASSWGQIKDKPFEKIGNNLIVDQSGRLSVDTASEVEEDNTKPITSAAVYTEVGNINALLALI